MKNITLLFLLVIGQITGLTAQVPAALGNRLQVVVDSISTKFNIKGISAAVLIPQVGTWKGTYGYSHDAVKLTPDMLFCMGSNTKTHISVLLLKLQENGKVDLDDTIGTWIKGYPYINGQVTMRQCLNHSSGIADYFSNDAINDSILGKPTKIWTDDEILRMATAPLFNPGTSWSYSNTNYIILGMILKDILKKSPFAALDELILQPNGLTHTFYFGEQLQSAVYAHPWTMNLTGNSLTDITTTSYLDQLFSLATTAGGLMTTAEENVMFWNKLFSGGIISADSWNEMTTMIKVTAYMEYGLGIMRRKNTNGRMVYEHGGTFFGYLHENMVDINSGVCISVLTNQDSINNSGLQALYVVNLQKEILRSGVLSVSEKPQTNLDISVYPNPATTALHITFNSEGEAYTAELYDLLGRKVIAAYLTNSTTTIDVNDLPAGAYFLKVRNNHGEISAMQKVIIGK